MNYKFIVHSPELEPFVKEWQDDPETLETYWEPTLPFIEIHIFPRSVVNQEWWEKWYCGTMYDIEPLPEGYYAFRAWADYPMKRIVMLFDETETYQSFWWLLFHELTHMACAHAPFIRWGFMAQIGLNGTTEIDNRFDDDAHENDPEEQFCNQIATSMMGGREFNRRWWRLNIRKLELTKQIPERK